MRKRHPNQHELTPRQRAILVYGDSQGITGRGFLNQEEEAGMWMRHRRELLAAAGSAGRPAAYFKFELCEITPTWVGDIRVLFCRGVLEAPGETASLRADQAADLNSEFESPESIRALNLPTPTLESLAREFGHILAYHAYRGRPALIAKYARIHEAIRSVLRETLVPLIPPKKETIQ